MTSTARDLACKTPQRGFKVILLGHEYGSADFQKLEELEGRLQEEVDDSPAGLLVDLGETIYIGCGLLSILLRCDARCREGNRGFALCTLNSSTAGVLAITRLDSFWEIFRTRREAIESMQRPLNNKNSNAWFSHMEDQ